jgi:type IV pilus assembly protein PilY1
LGYSFGNPVVTKLSNGDWVVLITSGYNNVSPGDGKGYLYVLDPLTGEKKRKIGTGMGDTAAPSGLSRIAAWVDNPNIDNTTKFVYGGDLLGNVWRFDINRDGVYSGDKRLANPAPIAHLVDDATPTPLAQPVTTRPELGDINGTRVIFVGTGKYLEPDDIAFGTNPAASQLQTIYGVADRYDEFATATASGVIADIRDSTASVKQQMTLDPTTKIRKVLNADTKEVNFASAHRAWYVDLFTNNAVSGTNDNPGERVNIDLQLVQGTLLVASNIPNADGICASGGTSYLNFFDYKTGASAGGEVVSIYTGNALIVGFVVLKLDTGFVVNVTLSDQPTPQRVDGVVIGTGSGTDSFSNTRTSWREIFAD